MPNSDASPIGQGNYVVRAGDCMESIAFEHGFLWQSLWDLPENAELKSKRDPNILMPGDRVTIPAIRQREESAATDQCHTYVRKIANSLFQLRFLDEHQEPRSGVPYLLTIDGKTTSGELDGGGKVSVQIPPNAKGGKIELQTEPDPESYDLDFGHLDPDSTPDGLRARLNNLGFACSATGPWDEDLGDALKRFQLTRDLGPTGERDDNTRQALKRDHLS